MAVYTSRGKLRRAGCPSKKSTVPRAHMYTTDKVGGRETKRNKTTALHTFRTHTHTQTCFLEESRLRIIKEYQKHVETTLVCIFSATNQKISRLRTKLTAMKGKEQKTDFTDFLYWLICQVLKTWTKMRKGLSNVWHHCIQPQKVGLNHKWVRLLDLLWGERM